MRGKRLLAALNRYKFQVLAGGLILAALALAFMIGGSGPALPEPTETPTPSQERTAAPSLGHAVEAPGAQLSPPPAEKPQWTPAGTLTEGESYVSPSPAVVSPSPSPAGPSAGPSPSPTAEAASPSPTPPPPAEPSPAQPSPVTTAEPVTPTPDQTEPPEPSAEPAPSETPTERPLPVDQPEHTQETHTCTLSVRCDTILDHMDRLDPDKAELVPQDGVIFPETTVTFQEGDSVFDVLQRELRQAEIHMEFANTPIYNSAYIEGIANLYEFDCGETSGWMYRVNGWFPNYGSSRYQLREGDLVEWVYTCDLGADVGDQGADGQQTNQRDE